MNEEQFAFEAETLSQWEPALTDTVWCQTCDKHISMSWRIVMYAMTYDAAMARHLDSHVKGLKQDGVFAYGA